MRPSRPTRTSVLLVLGLLLWTSTAHAQWYRDYEEGVKAVEQKRWAVAEEKLTAAKRSGNAPRPGRRVNFRSQIYGAYIPDFYLAVVYRNTGREQQALQLLRQVEQAGLVRQGDPEYSVLQQELRLAEAKVTPPAATTTQPVRVAENTTSVPVPAPQTTTSTPGPLPRATTTTQPADTFNALIRAAQDDASAGRPAEARAKLAEARALNVDNARVDALLRTLAAPPADVTPQRAAELERQLRAALGARDPGRAESLLRDLEVANSAAPALSQLRVQVRSLRLAANERQALRAYLSGRYDSAVRLLEDAVGNGAGAPPRTLFYLACSQAALALTSPSDRDRLVTRARSNYAKLAAARGFSANWRYVSPVVRRLLEGPGSQSGPG